MFRSFLTFVAEEKYDQAYELQGEGMKKLMTKKQWSEFETDFRKRSGGRPQFGNIRATWYKDPPNAEGPGIYVAFDYACRYENINICSGVVILHSMYGDKFNVMRNEKNFIDKETEAKLKAKESAKANTGTEPLQETTSSKIEYPSPKVAFEALQAKPGVEFREEPGGWIIANDKKQNAIWSFPPSSDPSFPSVVKRVLAEDAQGINLKMDVLCGASKEACDNLVRQFLELNEKIKNEISKKRQGV